MIKKNKNDAINKLYKISKEEKGYIKLINVKGDQNTIIQCARISYNLEDKEVDCDKDYKGLLRYLLRNKHWSPFEMPTFIFDVFCPIYVARQWQRHRTFKFNELSMRYTEFEKDNFYIPKELRKQSENNKQGSGEILTSSRINKGVNIIKKVTKYAETKYFQLLELGVSKELARMILPLNSMTKIRMQIDLRNLLHFISLRDDIHAQNDIRKYAKILAKIVEEYFPDVYEEFKIIDTDEKMLIKFHNGRTKEEKRTGYDIKLFFQQDPNGNNFIYTIKKPVKK